MDADVAEAIDGINQEMGRVTERITSLEQHLDEVIEHLNQQIDQQNRELDEQRGLVSHIEDELKANISGIDGR